VSASPPRSRLRPPAPGAAVTLRPAEARDCRRTWLWRNDEETRRVSFDSSPIPYETHERWFTEALASDRRKLYVVLGEGQEAGVARLDLDGRQARVSIHLAPERRGQGLGPAALRALADRAFDELEVDALVASVKGDNHASLSAFAKAGFAVAEAGAVVMLARSRVVDPHPGPLPPEGEGASMPPRREVEGVVPAPSPPEGERVRVRGRAGDRRR